MIRREAGPWTVFSQTCVMTGESNVRDAHKVNRQSYTRGQVVRDGHG